MTFNIKKIRTDFPILNQKVHGQPLVYLDNGATTQKPQCVIDTIIDFYTKQNSNIHRGVHHLSEQATIAYENSRKTIQKFINAQHTHEVIFTRGTTESINLIASSFSEKFIGEGDEIIISAMEHHSNIVPWQIICKQKKAKLKIIPFDDDGNLLIDEFDKLLNNKTKFISITHVSNSIGTVNPIKEIIDKAHAINVPVLIDGAQSIQHTPIDVQKLDCDFFVFSGHKIYAPTGIGILYGKEELLNQMPPYQSGGDMIETVTFEKTIYNGLPLKFEAGTTNFVGAIAQAKAIEYIQNIGIEKIEKYEKELLDYATKKLKQIDGMTIYCNSKSKSGLISFLINGIHHLDTGMILDKMGIAIRTGHHCAEPVMHRLGIAGTVRASFAFYNTKEEIDRLYNGLMKVSMMFK